MARSRTHSSPRCISSEDIGCGPCICMGRGNGVMLCRVCHTAFDRSLWSVSHLGSVVVSDALLSAADDDVRSYWLARNGRRLKTPASLVHWPLAKTWAFHAAGCVAARELRHTKPKFPCDACGKLCKSPRGVTQHKSSSSCAQNCTARRPVMMTPKSYGKPSGSSAERIPSLGHPSTIGCGDGDHVRFRRVRTSD